MDSMPTTTESRPLLRLSCQRCRTVYLVRDVDVVLPNGTVVRQHLCTDCCGGRTVVVDRGRASWRY